MNHAEKLTRRVDAALARTRDELESLVRIPSVSAFPQAAERMRESAEAVAELARTRGLDAEVVELETAAGLRGRPAVLAHRRAAPGQPTVLLYAHHDVQPAGSPDGWLSEPFEPVERDGRLYGRGTADDKAGIMVHLGALAALGGESGLGVTLFVEGEEEVGSPTFKDFLAAYADRLAADVIVVADSNNWKVGVPSLTTSLRGVVTAEFTVRTLDHALHSGMYGGPVLDAVTCAARLVATLHDADGAVAVRGLASYDDATAEYAEEDLRADTGLLDGVRLTGRGSIASRLWTQPSLTVIGMDVTSTAEASNTLIPACTVRLSLRVAPGQDPGEAAQARATIPSPAAAPDCLTVRDNPIRAPPSSSPDQPPRVATSTARAISATSTASLCRPPIHWRISSGVAIPAHRAVFTGTPTRGAMRFTTHATTSRQARCSSRNNRIPSHGRPPLAQNTAAKISNAPAG